MLDSERPKQGHSRHFSPSYTYSASPERASGPAVKGIMDAGQMFRHSPDQMSSPPSRPKTSHGRRHRLSSAQAQSLDSSEEWGPISPPSYPAQEEVFVYDARSSPQHVPTGEIVPHPPPAGRPRQRPKTGYARRRQSEVTSPSSRAELIDYGGGQDVRSRPRMYSASHRHSSVDAPSLRELGEFSPVNAFGRFPVLPSIGNPKAHLREKQFEERSLSPSSSSSSTGLAVRDQSRYHQSEATISSRDPSASSASSYSQYRSTQLPTSQTKPSSEETGMKIAVRLPNGARLEGHFRNEDTLSSVLTFVTSSGQGDWTADHLEVVDGSDRRGKAYTHGEMRVPLDVLGIKDRSVLIVQEKED